MFLVVDFRLLILCVSLPRGLNLDIYTHTEHTEGKKRRKSSSTISPEKCFKNEIKVSRGFPSFVVSHDFFSKGPERHASLLSRQQTINTFCVFNGILIVQQIIVINYFQFNGAGKAATSIAELGSARLCSRVGSDTLSVTVTAGD